MKYEVYDADYFERGVATGKSLYENYRWIPELTIPMAMTIIDYLGIKRGASVLDFGCAKGYLVKALRMLGREAIGIDISQYAISSIDQEVAGHCFTRAGDGVPCPDYPFEYCIAKDVFEHIEPEHLAEDLQWINAEVLFAIIPLADDGTYRVPAYEFDRTHVIRWDEREWAAFFRENGWVLERFEFRVPGIKDNWERFELGNGFFTLRKENA